MTKLDFDKMQGLIPAVLQDADGGEVLMLGFMNPSALAETLRSPQRLCHFFQSHPEPTLDEG